MENWCILIWVLISLIFGYGCLLLFAEGKPIPTELRNEEAALRQEIDLEDENTASMYRSSML